MVKKILIIEDEPILREMYSKKLSEEGFQVLLADQAEKGLDLAKSEKPDLVLLDILLPKENGIYFLEELRSNLITKDIKVLAFSNLEDDTIQQKAQALKVVDYLIKTHFTPEEVVKEIKKYV